jgi:hypothetical protein
VTVSTAGGTVGVADTTEILAAEGGGADVVLFGG